MTRTRLAVAAVAAALLLGTSGPRAAAAAPAGVTAVFAESHTNGKGYWKGFVDFWTGSFKKQNGVVMIALGVGALGLAIIVTGGKWRK